MTSTAAAVAAWQNTGRGRARLAALIAEAGARTPEVSRGMVITGDAAEIVARFTGPVTLDPSSFTTLDAVADEFACLDAQVPADAVRVKVWTEGARGLEVAAQGDEGFAWEREWVVAGDFTGVAELDEGVVVVTLTPVD